MERIKLTRHNTIHHCLLQLGGHNSRDMSTLHAPEKLGWLPQHLPHAVGQLFESFSQLGSCPFHQLPTLRHSQLVPLVNATSVPARKLLLGNMVLWVLNLWVCLCLVVGPEPAKENILVTTD